MKLKRLAALLLALSMMFALAACGGDTPPADSQPAESQSDGQESTTPEDNTPEPADENKSAVEGMTVAYIPKLTGNAFFEAANVGAQKYAAEWGMTVDYMGDPNATAAAQVAVINDAVAKGVDAICISAVDAAGVSTR